MKQPYFTRKNLIVLSISIFYGLIIGFTGMCIEGSHAIMSSRNIIQALATALGFPSITTPIVGYIGLMMIALYIVVFAASVLYIRKYAINNNIKLKSVKVWLLYFVSLLACALLSIGFTIALTTPKTAENIGTIMTFLGQAMALGTLIFAVLFLLIGAALMLVINLIFIDKPFRFSEDMEEIDMPEEEAIDVAASFDAPTAQGERASAGVNAIGGIGGEGVLGGGEMTALTNSEKLADREIVFPSLSAMDIEYDGYAVEEIQSDEVTLNELCERFRNYLADKEGLYFDEQTIRMFIAAFGASHFMILEGLSGTGKSSLPRYFAKFVKGNALFMPVQTTWRDKSNILGFFNDFSKTYTETDFLLHLYHAVYNPDQIHVFVLDEMNISRVEYYFADLLSVLEYPQDEWKLRLMQIPHDFLPPAKVDNGYIQISPNCYFVGTANKDDSTFSISDKVYDRAITMEFDNRNQAFKPQGNSEGITLSHSKLLSLYQGALENTENAMHASDFEKFDKLTAFVDEQFDVTFGNRVMMQIEKLVPIYVACGGTKEEALDFIFSRKVLAKIDGRFEDYVKGALKQLLSLMAQTYGKGVLARSEKAINLLIKKL